MAASKLLLLFALFLTLLFSPFTARDSDSSGIASFPEAKVSDNHPNVDPSHSRGVSHFTSEQDAGLSSLEVELDEFKLEIRSLESSIVEKTRELKSKDEQIGYLENIIEETSTKLARLQGEIESLQERSSINAKELVHKAQASANELGKQVVHLQKERELQDKEINALEAKAGVAEKNIHELNIKLETLERISNEQKSRIRKTECAIRVAEEEMMKAKLEATFNSDELREVHKGWFPPWLSAHIVYCQSQVVSHWSKHGRPALNVAVQKALENKAQVEKWAELHIDAFRTKWVPHFRKCCSVFIANIEPCLQPLATKTIEGFHASKKSIEPLVVKLHKMVEPYYQEAVKFTNPYIDRVWIAAKPHIDNASVILKPYKKKLLRGYKKLRKLVTKYHYRVQANIDGILKGNELTKPYATNQLVWLLASVLMAFPAIFFIQMASSLFCKRPKIKHRRSTHTSHSRRRARLHHPEN